MVGQRFIMIIFSGADVNIRINYEESPLSLTASKWCFLKSGAEFNVRTNYGRNPLHLATSHWLLNFY